MLKKKKNKIYYTIEYHKLMGKYVLWKNVDSENGYASKGIYSGTKKECEKFLKDLKISSK